jgi:hypothetical protein
LLSCCLTGLSNTVIVIVNWVPERRTPFIKAL